MAEENSTEEINYKWDYSTNYKRPVDAEWVAKQFKLYDSKVREYYDPRAIFNEFDGTSWNSPSDLTDISYKIVHLGDLQEPLVVSHQQWKLCSKDDLSNMIETEE